MSNSSPLAGKSIFLDHHSSTPVDPRVLNAMLPYFIEQFANPHSVEHNLGLRAARAVEAAQTSIANLIHANAEEIVFTSGATESNNLALRGIAAGHKKAHFVTSNIEHSSIATTFDWLEREGFSVTRLPVDSHGCVNPDVVGAALTASTVLVSIQAANGEIGTIQQVSAIGRVCREHGALFHTDAVQAFGQVPLDVRRDCIDLMSLSAHKIYGPKGIGALFVAADVRRRLRPQITGGDQQHGLRAGTVPTPLAIGFGRAAMLSAEEGSTHHERIAKLRDRLFARLSHRLPGIWLNGSPAGRLPGNLNLCIEGVDAESLLPMLPNVALSTGSACRAGALSASPVLLAIGLPVAIAQTALRIGIGRENTVAEIDEAVERIAQAVEILRS